MAYLNITIQDDFFNDIVEKHMIKIVRETKCYYYIATMDFTRFGVVFNPGKRVLKKSINNIDYVEFPDELFDKCKAVASKYMSDYLEFINNIKLYSGSSVEIDNFYFFYGCLCQIMDYTSECYLFNYIECNSSAWFMEQEMILGKELQKMMRKKKSCWAVEKQDAMRAYDFFKDCLIELFVTMDDYLLEARKKYGKVIEEETWIKSC